MAETEAVKSAEKKPWGVPFVAGDPRGNLKGRPKGSRNKLGEDFLKAMADDFQENGPEAIQKVRETKPHEYLKIIASILPKIISVQSDEFENQSDDELRIAYAREVRKLIAFGVAVGVDLSTGNDEEARTIEAIALPPLQKTG